MCSEKAQGRIRNREERVRRLGEFRREEKRLRSCMRAIFKYCSWAFDTKKRNETCLLPRPSGNDKK